jgi:hypothetical protein
MNQSNTQIDLGIPQSFRAGRQATHLDRFDPVSPVGTGSLQAEPLLDCVGAAVVLGGVHPKTVERWAREAGLSLFPALEIPRLRARTLDALSCKFSLPSVPLKPGGIGWNISGNGFSLVGLI